jgi:Uma2 family endonuclease
MREALRWTTADLDLLPDRLDGTRYEIIDGELYVSRAPEWDHQAVSGRAYAALQGWSDETGAGAAAMAPGLVLPDDDNVIPDVVWVSARRLVLLRDQRGHLTGAPELVVEVLSRGEQNEQRDRTIKLNVYSRRGALEYWIVDWRLRQVEVYRREEGALRLVATLHEADVLESPVLPGFRLSVAELFVGVQS